MGIFQQLQILCAICLQLRSQHQAAPRQFVQFWDLDRFIVFHCRLFFCYRTHLSLVCYKSSTFVVARWYCTLPSEYLTLQYHQKYNYCNDDVSHSRELGICDESGMFLPWHMYVMGANELWGFGGVCYDATKDEVCDIPPPSWDPKIVERREIGPSCDRIATVGLP